LLSLLLSLFLFCGEEALHVVLVRGLVAFATELCEFATGVLELLLEFCDSHLCFHLEDTQLRLCGGRGFCDCSFDLCVLLHHTLFVSVGGGGLHEDV